jgi:hypothetical protein
MTNFTQLINEWKNLSDENCQLIKDEIYKLIPIWNNEDNKISCVKALDSKYVFYKDYFDDHSQCVLYDCQSEKFVLCDNYWKNYLPDGGSTVIKTFTTRSLDGKEIIVVFFKYTGIYGAQISKHIPDNSSTSCFRWFKDVKILEECVSYCETSSDPSFSIVDNEIGHTKIYHNFDTEKLMDRYERWYNGQWAEMEKNGILDNSDYSSTWNNGSVIYELAFRTTDCNQFSQEITKFMDDTYGCDICNKHILFSKLYHCPTCITWNIDEPNNFGHKYTSQIAYNECEECYIKTTHPHQLLCAKDPIVRTKYINQYTEIQKFYQQQNDEYRETEDIKKIHREEKIRELTAKLNLNKDKDQILDFIQNNDSKFLVVKDPNVVFSISSTFQHLYIFTNILTFKNWLKTVCQWSIYLIYLSDLNIKDSADIINMCEHTALKVITSSDYIPPAINMINAEQKCGGEFYCSVIKFIHTGMIGIALKYYHISAPENIQTDIYWFANNDKMNECFDVLKNMLELGWTGSCFDREKLISILSSVSYKEKINLREKQWYDGYWQNQDLYQDEYKNEYKNEFRILTLDEFNTKISFLKKHKFNKHFIRCC